MITLKCFVADYDLHDLNSRDVMHNVAESLRQLEPYDFLAEYGEVDKIMPYKNIEQMGTTFIVHWKLKPEDELMYHLKYGGKSYSS